MELSRDQKAMLGGRARKAADHTDRLLPRQWPLSLLVTRRIGIDMDARSVAHKVCAPVSDMPPHAN
jgi:hypothetical protein